MGLEGNTDRQGRKKGLLPGAVFGAALLATSAAGINEGYENLMERINSHVLSPATIELLKQQGGASDRDIGALEGKLREILPQELKRVMKTDE